MSGSSNKVSRLPRRFLTLNSRINVMKRASRKKENLSRRGLEIAVEVHVRRVESERNLYSTSFQLIHPLRVCIILKPGGFMSPRCLIQLTAKLAFWYSLRHQNEAYFARLMQLHKKAISRRHNRRQEGEHQHAPPLLAIISVFAAARNMGPRALSSAIPCYSLLLSIILS